jgi:hypothetical protein
MVVVFNATFSNISVIYRGGQFYWVPEEIHRPVASLLTNFIT